MIGSLHRALCFIFGFGPIVWSCKEQKLGSLSTTKEEYCGAINAGTNATWIPNLLDELEFLVEESIVVYCENHCAI